VSTFWSAVSPKRKGMIILWRCLLWFKSSILLFSIRKCTERRFLLICVAFRQHHDKVRKQALSFRRYLTRKGNAHHFPPCKLYDFVPQMGICQRALSYFLKRLCAHHAKVICSFQTLADYWGRWSRSTASSGNGKQTKSKETMEYKVLFVFRRAEMLRIDWRREIAFRNIRFCLRQSHMARPGDAIHIKMSIARKYQKKK
jgi:hypothetical protein